MLGHDIGRGGDRNLTIAILPDGSGTYSDYGGDRNLTVVANPDGSGSFGDLGGGLNVTVTALPDGSWSYVDQSVADRFPPLDKLGKLQPPCATVIRMDADVLFDFDSDQLRRE